RVAGAVHEQDELSALDLLDLPGEQLADLVGELVPDPLALVLAHALDDPLLHGHDGVPAEVGDLDGDLHHVADLEGLVVPARLLERDLGGRVLDLLDDAAEDHDVELAGVLVDVDLGLYGRPVDTCETRQDPVLDEVRHLLVGQALGGRDVPERRYDLRRVRHLLSPHFHVKTRFAFRMRSTGTPTSSPPGRRRRTSPLPASRSSQPSSSPSRRRESPRSASWPCTTTCSPRKRSKSRGRTSGRSTPGDETSIVYR